MFENPRIYMGASYYICCTHMLLLAYLFTILWFIK
jgi:hypothetical protein